MGLIAALIIIVVVFCAVAAFIIGGVYLIGAAGYYLSTPLLAFLTIGYSAILYFKTSIFKFSDWEIDHMQSCARTGINFSFRNKVLWYLDKERLVSWLLVSLPLLVIWLIAFFARWDGTEEFFASIHDFIFR